MASALAWKNLSAGYGDTVVLENIDLALKAGEALSIIGRNGVGKTTLLATAMGQTTLRAGEVLLDSENIATLPIYRRALKGLGFVPQEREIFPSLSVRENLEIAARGGYWTPDRIYSLFPRLRERLGNMGNQLSGGEQQMLSIARALMTNPQVLLMDEPTEGLAPGAGRNACRSARKAARRRARSPSSWSSRIAAWRSHFRRGPWSWIAAGWCMMAPRRRFATIPNA